MDSAIYGLGILRLVFLYVLHRAKLLPQKQFQSLKRRYIKVEGLGEPAGHVKRP
jgi:hypothetical protein